MNGPSEELRKGSTPWTRWTTPGIDPAHLPKLLVADNLIIGAGITGAFLAERFSRDGRSIIVLDRHCPETASTMASTGLLAWELDASLSELSTRIGFEQAKQVYFGSIEGVKYISDLVSRLRLNCGFSHRYVLNLEGNKLNGAAFENEFRLRRQLGMREEFFPPQRTKQVYGFPARAAIRSSGCAQVDPVALARELFARAIARGVKIISPVNVTNYDFGAGQVHLCTQEGLEIIGKTLLLATGYEMPPFVPAANHRIVSTWAISTSKQSAEALWPGGDMVWESASPYFYMRTAQNSIIIGGEDEPIDDAQRRDSLLSQKKEKLRAKLSGLAPKADPIIDYAWTAFFGITDDTLPLIGPVPGYERAFAAYGYGGNGITFSALASNILHELANGRNHPLAENFALCRPACAAPATLLQAG